MKKTGNTIVREVSLDADDPYVKFMLQDQIKRQLAERIR